MNFVEAVEAMRMGKAVRRKGWPGTVKFGLRGVNMWLMGPHPLLGGNSLLRTF